jgi:uncharacterized protein YdbL (DUF1318 family)
MTRLNALLVVAPLLGLSSGAAFAVNLDDAKIQQQLESQGYSNVQIVKREKNHVDVTAMKNGKSEKLEVDSNTGRVEPDDDDD